MLLIIPEHTDGGCFMEIAREHFQDDFIQVLRNAHVLVLGTDGPHASLIGHLCELGVGRLTLLDRDPASGDRVGTGRAQIAAEQVRAADPAIKVEARYAGVHGPEDVAELVDCFAPVAVASGVDQPRGVDDWVNAACVTRGVPYVRSGAYPTYGLVTSVDPGMSACRACAAFPPEPADQPRPARHPPVTGPAAGLLGALAAFELVRYLTRYEPPVYAARPAVVDFVAGCAITQDPAWSRNPACPVCGPG